MKPEPAEAAAPENVGQRLRELRQGSGMSLRALALKLGISASALSQIETGAKVPSVNRLLGIVSALGVPLAAVFESTPSAHDENDHVVSRAGEVPLMKLEGGVVYRRLSPLPVAGLEIFESTYPAGAAGSAHGDLIDHEGFEIGSISSGELTITFENEVVTLAAGDSITFSATRGHRLSNQGTVPCVAVWVIAQA